MNIDPLERRYVDEMKRNANLPVELHILLVDLGAVISAMQLALRHPDFPLTVRGQVEGFIGQTIAAVEKAFPAIAEGWRRGNDPQYDPPPDRRRDRR